MIRKVGSRVPVLTLQIIDVLNQFASDRTFETGLLLLSTSCLPGLIFGDRTGRQATRRESPAQMLTVTRDQ